MKFRFTVALLIVSLLLNVAGLIFFIQYLQLRGHYKRASRERDTVIRNLTMARMGTMGTPDPVDRVSKRVFYSEVDGQPDTFAVVAPMVFGAAKDMTLVVYLHGMGGSYTEPFLYPQGQTIQQSINGKYSEQIFISCNYRQPAAWGNDAALSDITQNLRELCLQYPIAHIVIMGTSMGGCTALTYACAAPADIKSKISGVISAEGSGDLISLYRVCPMQAVKAAMVVAFGGTPEQVPEIYKKKSFVNNVDSFPAARVAVLSARQDKIVPPVLQHNIVEALEQHHIPVKLIEVDGPHQPLPGASYVQAMDFVMGKGGG